MTTALVDIDWRGRQVEIETLWLQPGAIGTADAGADAAADLATSAERSRPLIVFLHEGLGSVAMWKDFPQQLCDAAGGRGLVYSRPGYGRSTFAADDDTWAPDFMHQQAFEVLPALLQALQVQDPPWLLGHSDGGSIALLHASRCSVAGVVVMAPHIVVEQLSLDSIGKARDAWLQSDLPQRLARYHNDAPRAFRRWNDMWLDPAFRNWDITDVLPHIHAPLLALQGVDDEYGTLAQIEGIAALVPQAQLLALQHCGHSPHRDQPKQVIAAVSRFIAAHSSADTLR